MRRLRAGPVLLACSTAALVTLVAQSGWAQEVPEVRTVVSGLDFPAGVAFDDDGTMFVSERAGAIRVVEGTRLRDRPLAEIPTVVSGETGLLGIAVSPDGDALYAFATDPGGDSNSVWRVPLDDPGAARRVVGDLPASGYHNGGGVAFDGDGMLLVSNGEQHDSARAQDPGVLGGKVYRFTPDGRVPDDNPFGASPSFSIGLRNPFGLAVDPVSGAPWVTENGPEAWDEVNRLERGSNHGWPEVSGPGDPGEVSGDYRDPVLGYEQIIVPTGIAFAGADARSGWRGDLFFGTYGESSLHRVRLDRGRTEAVSDEVIVRGEPVIGVAWGPRGLYFTTPDAVRLLPIAVGEGAAEEEPSSSPTPEPEPEPTAADGSAETTTDRDDGSGGLLTALVLGALALAFWWTRKRLKRHDNERDYPPGV